MSDLPRGWVKASGDDLFSSVRGVTYSKSDSSHTPGNGLVPILRANNIVGGGITTDDLVFVPAKCVSPEQNLQDGDLLIASSSGSRTVVGKAATASDDDRIYAFGAFCTVARPRTGDLGRWLAAYSRSRAYRDYVEKVALGISINNLRGSDLKAIPIPVAPLREQRRIVAKIDSLTGKSRRARDHLDHIPRLVEKYKQAILAAAFRGDLTREWREGRSLAATRSVLLGEVAEGFNYGSAAKSAKQGRVPVLRMGNIQDGKLDWADLVFTDDAAEIAKYRLKNGDVLFNRTNSPALVGKTALFTGKREAIYAGYLIKVRCKPQLLPAFLTYCLNAPNGRAYSWEVKTDGVSQSNINAKKLAAFRFDLPSVQEQEEIVRRIERALSWINRVTVDATSARKLIDHLDNSVLAKAFRGELVPQDPADEPASALLDRIREERAAAPKAKRGRKKAA
ncbi:restriction endonuclease subunit S [Acetobacter senegalensis]|uniref:restriction endonuclease subunit S n=1 Tax=Acetobacter senegalensis TaxID=446692 RepID=UPI00264AB7F5|nr:restriction endonuclease subunit S [Acetobacter senegalensis]MDN7351324.1 restriction endonuclease subunit S [Acetobacter senegalensis]